MITTRVALSSTFDARKDWDVSAYMKKLAILTVMLVSCAHASAQEKRWPFPITREDGHDTGNLVCGTKSDYQDFFRKPVSEQTMYTVNRDFFASGRCYTLMSDWDVSIAREKNSEDYIVKYTIATKRHGTITAYGAGIEDE
ncbi:hypothetical protein [Acetobacter nitrogenifigens]|uniref:hypothetical protein n=1 Tax=Acetobacter nitrogenifigens TaxID=285268 RepID=UPI0013773130|nr:hypothetical protein [Acetobacter nitrogenifigens]